MRDVDYEDYKPFKARRPRVSAAKLWWRRNRESFYYLFLIIHILGAFASIGYLFLTIPDKLMFLAFAAVITFAARWGRNV